MPVQKQIVSVPINGQILDKVDPKIGPFVNFSLLENTSRKRAGEIRKRYGYDQVFLTSSNYAPGATSVGGLTQASNHSLIDFQGRMALLSKASGTNDFYAYRKFTQNSSWNTYAESRLPRLTTTAYQSVSQNSLFTIKNIDCALSGNILCVVYDRSDAVGGNGRILAAFYDVSEGVLLRTDAMLSNETDNNSSARVVVNGSNFQVFWYDGTTNIKTRLIAVSTGAFASEFTLANDAANPQHDAIIYNGQIAYCYGTTGNATKVLLLNSSGTVATSTTLSGTNAAVVNQSLATDGTDLFLAYHSNSVNQIRVYKLDSSLSVLTGPITFFTGGANTIQNIGITVIGSTLYLYFGATNTVFEQRTTQVTSNLSLASLATTIVCWGTTVTSKPSSIDSKPLYMLGGVLDPNETFKTGSSFFTAELWAKVLQSETNLAEVNVTIPTTVVSGTKVYIPVRRSIDVLNGVLVGGVGISIIETAASYVPSVKVGNTTIIGGGVLKSYDGYQVQELGWLEVPSKPAVISTSSGSMAAGTYQYTYILEANDSQGNLYRSPIAEPVSVTLGGTGSVTVRFQYFGITTRNSANGYLNENGKIVIFRTESNGSVFYRLSESRANLANEATVSFTINDNTPDSGLGDEILYTTGDVLEDEAPPASAVINTFKNRVFLVPSEDRSSVWYSKELQPNEGVAFSSLLQFRVDPIGGDITALSEMDDKIVIFKQNAILYTIGDGANNLGQGGYNVPLLVTSELGAIDYRSVIRTNDGIMFKSHKGIYLLDRGLNVQYIGAGVENYNNKTITSAINIPSISQTRFTTSDGEILVFESVFKEWFVWTGLGSKSSVIDGSDYSILKTDGNIWKESSSYTDNTNAQIMRMITFPVQVAEIQGFQRIFRIVFLGEYRGSHKIRVRLAYNNNEYFEEQFEITPSSTTTWTDTTYQNTTYNPGSVVDNVWQFEVRPSRQVCENIRIMIEDNFDALSPGNSFVLSGILLEVGVLGGRFRVPPSTKVMT